VITAALLLCLLAAVWTGDGAGLTPAVRATVPLPELTLCGALALLPAVAVPASFLTGVFNTRYILPALIGITLVMILLVWWVCRGNRFTALVAASVFLSGFVVHSVLEVREDMAGTSGYPFRTAQPYAARPWMPLIAESHLPVVISPAVFFLPFQYYAPAEVKSRTYYLASRQYALQIEQTDSADAVLIHMARAVPDIHVASYDDFLGRERTFLLLTDLTGPAWVVKKLVNDRARLELLLRHNGQALFAVTRR
jgi:hypothetical protein